MTIKIKLINDNRLHVNATHNQICVYSKYVGTWPVSSIDELNTNATQRKCPKEQQN